MTDKQPPASRQLAEPPFLRDVVEPLTPRKPAKGAAEKSAQSASESKQPDQPERDAQPEAFLENYDPSHIQEERRERRWILTHATNVQAITSASSRPPGAG